MKTFMITRMRNSFGQWRPLREISEQELSNFPHTFQLKDADGNLQFIGQSISTSNLEPLDDLENNYGVTDLLYEEDGKFVCINC